MNRRLFFYLMPLLLLAASLLQSTTANRLQIRGVKPDLVLLLVIIGTLIYGSRAGVLWAFIGGVTVDLFSGGPLGSSSLAMIVATAIVGIGSRSLSRYNLLVPLTAIMVGTLIYSAVYLGILIALEGITHWSALQAYEFSLVRPDLGTPIWASLFWPTMQFIVLPALFYNTALMLLIIPLLSRVPESTNAEYF